MGKNGAPFYCEDLGSAIEQAEKAIAKIKTNKFDKEDLENLAEALVEIQKVVNED